MKKLGIVVLFILLMVVTGCASKEDQFVNLWPKGDKFVGLWYLKNSEYREFIVIRVCL